MKKLIATTALTLGVIANAFAASPECVLDAEKPLMEEDIFKQYVEELGYKVDEIQKSEGNCFAVTGQNNIGQDVTAFFNPQSGQFVQEDVVQ